MTNAEREARDLFKSKKYMFAQAVDKIKAIAEALQERDEKIVKLEKEVAIAKDTGRDFAKLCDSFQTQLTKAEKKLEMAEFRHSPICSADAGKGWEKKFKCWVCELEKAEAQLTKERELSWGLVEALREMKHQAHHTIEEEIWRVDKVIQQYNRKD